MKTGILMLSIATCFLFASCKGGSSENQGYDSGPTTKSESGSTASGQGTTTDSTAVNEDENQQ